MTDRAELIRILREPFDRNPYTLPELCAVTADLLEADQVEIARLKDALLAFTRYWRAGDGRIQRAESLLDSEVK